MIVNEGDLASAWSVDKIVRFLISFKLPADQLARVSLLLCQRREEVVSLVPTLMSAGVGDLSLLEEIEVTWQRKREKVRLQKEFSSSSRGSGETHSPSTAPQWRYTAHAPASPPPAINSSTAFSPRLHVTGVHPPSATLPSEDCTATERNAVHDLYRREHLTSEEALMLCREENLILQSKLDHYRKQYDGLLTTSWKSPERDAHLLLSQLEESNNQLVAAKHQVLELQNDLSVVHSSKANQSSECDSCQSSRLQTEVLIEAVQRMAYACNQALCLPSINEKDRECILSHLCHALGGNVQTILLAHQQQQQQQQHQQQRLPPDADFAPIKLSTDTEELNWFVPNDSSSRSDDQLVDLFRPCELVDHKSNKTKPTASALKSETGLVEPVIVRVGRPLSAGLSAERNEKESTSRNPSSSGSNLKVRPTLSVLPLSGPHPSATVTEFNNPHHTSHTSLEKHRTSGGKNTCGYLSLTELLAVLQKRQNGPATQAQQQQQQQHHLPHRPCSARSSRSARSQSSQRSRGSERSTRTSTSKVVGYDFPVREVLRTIDHLYNSTP
eukprot:scaffold1046_cov162-Ochromonas_danica.AAC.18